jgi:hypothetical protein
MQGKYLPLCVAILMASGGCCSPWEQSRHAAFIENPTQSELTALENSGTPGIVWIIGWLEYDCIFQVMDIGNVPSVFISQVRGGLRVVEGGRLFLPEERFARNASLILSHPQVVSWAKARGSVKKWGL